LVNPRSSDEETGLIIGTSSCPQSERSRYSLRQNQLSIFVPSSFNGNAKTIEGCCLCDPQGRPKSKRAHSCILDGPAPERSATAQTIGASRLFRLCRRRALCLGETWRGNGASERSPGGGRSGSLDCGRGASCRLAGLRCGRLPGARGPRFRSRRIDAGRQH